MCAIANPTSIPRESDSFLAASSSSSAAPIVQKSLGAPTQTEELLARHVLHAKVRSATLSLDLTQTAFDAASLAHSLKKVVVQKDAVISTQTNQIQHLETRLAEEIAENQAIRHQLQTQADQLVLQGANNEVLSTRLEQNQVRCSQLEQELVTERTRLIDRKNFDRLKTERIKLKDACDEHIAMLGVKSATTMVALSFFITPFLAVPIGSLYGTKILCTNKEWHALEEQRIVVSNQIAEIKARNPDFR